MRRYLTPFLCLCLLLCGCGSKAKEVVQSNETVVTTPTIVETSSNLPTEISETAPADNIVIGELVFPLGSSRKHDLLEGNINIISLTENITYISIMCTDMNVSGNMEPEEFASSLHSNWLTESATDAEIDFFHHTIINNDIYFEHQVTERQDNTQLYWLVGTFYTDSNCYTIAYSSITNEDSEIEKFSDYLDEVGFTSIKTPSLISVKSAHTQIEQTIPVETKEQTIGSTYVLNMNTRKFHRSGCSSVKKMKESNKSIFTGTRDDVITKGYEPCSNCNP